MVRPVGFRANRETFSSNTFQRDSAGHDIAELVLREHDGLAQRLRDVGVEVILLEPNEPHSTPDAVFPNNWFSTHVDGTLVTYPMTAPSRRKERRSDIAEILRSRGFRVSRHWDMSVHERDASYLEGTGSLVIDHEFRTVYANASSRTDRALAEQWATRMEHELWFFDAVDSSGTPIYHTNVMLAIGHGISVICPELIRDREMRDRVVRSLKRGGREVIELDLSQVYQFAGNQLFLAGRDGQVAVLSDAADRALTSQQKKIIDAHASRIVSAVPNLELFGGGSVRCMMAEIFLPRDSEEATA